MRAFVMSLVALVVITLVAAVGLGMVDMSSENVFSSEQGNVRL